MPEEEKKEDDKVILQVEMDCEGCKARVKKALKEIIGGEASFEVDMKGQKVTVKGMKMDPVKACEAVKKKSGKRTVLIHPDPKKLEEDQKKAAEAKEEPKKDVAPPPPDPEVVVVLRVHMHCGACAKQIKRNLLKMDGVTNVNDDFGSGTVTVIGKCIDPHKVCERVRKRSGKRCEIVPPPPPPTPPEEKKEEKKEEKMEEKMEEKKEDEQQKPSEETKKEETKHEPSSEKKDENKDEDTKEKKGENVEEEKKIEEKKEEKKEEATTPPTTEESNVEIKKYEYIPYRSIPGYVYPPQLFSDENPNACSIM